MVSENKIAELIGTVRAHKSIQEVYKDSPELVSIMQQHFAKLVEICTELEEDLYTPIGEQKGTYDFKWSSISLKD